MSGIGGYVVDIDEWGTNSTAAYFERNSIKITATFKENASLGLLYHNIKLRQSCVLKVTGIPEGCDAFWMIDWAIVFTCQKMVCMK